MLSSAWALAIALVLQTPAAAPPAAEGSPFVALPSNLKHDISALPSADAARLVAIGGVSALLAHQADGQVADWAGRSGDAEYADVGDALGNGWTQGGAALATYTVGMLTHDQFTAHVGSDLIRGQILNGIFTQGIKVAVGRVRPNGGHRSLPSGHTSAAFTSAAILGNHFGWRVAVPAYAAAGFVGWSRVRDDVHWVSDVVLGATIGTVIGRAITAGHRDRQWAVLPAATRGGVALYIVRLTP